MLAALIEGKGNLELKRCCGLMIWALCFPAWCVVSVSAQQQTASDTATPVALVQQRQQYREAMVELRTGMGPRYRALRQQLAGYPLVTYLDYEALIGQLHDLTPADANQFLATAGGSPLYERFRHAYLLHKGRDRHWREFLGVAPKAPRDIELQCYYYRAQRSVGDVNEAWRGAAALWNVGKSQDDACDILFERWISEGPGPDDDLVWSRALKAFDARNPHLIRYVKRFASKSLQPLLDELLSVYRRPDHLVTDAHESDINHAQLMTVGIRRLARVNPGKARLALENARAVQPFSDLQIEAMESLIVRHSLFAQSSAPEPWLVETLMRLRDDELTEIYLRNQVEEGDWAAILEGVAWLSEGVRAGDKWRYWEARAQLASGLGEAAQTIFIELAGQRSYHGFLAAQRLGEPYQLSPAEPVPVQSLADPAIDRVRELLALGEVEAARLEWRTLIARLRDEDRVVAARMALEAGWVYYAIHAANTARAWDEIALRFPVAFKSIFEAHAAEESVTTTELLAIARRESAMDPLAQSPVGALGLMQVMPATGKRVARDMGLSFKTSRLRTVDYNIALGAHYYRSLLDRFAEHRPKALAGYNAGPHRVSRWASTEMPTDRWIESLPFRETRDYVQNVLAYAVIYDQRAGRRPELLRQHELITYP